MIASERSSPFKDQFAELSNLKFILQWTWRKHSWKTQGDGDETYGQIGKSTCSPSFSCSIDLFLRCLDPTWQDHPPVHEILKHHLRNQMHDRGQGRRPTRRTTFALRAYHSRTLGSVGKLQHQEDATLLLLLEQTRSGIDKPSGKPPNTLVVRTLRNSDIRLSVLTANNIQKSK